MKITHRITNRITKEELTGSILDVRDGSFDLLLNGTDTIIGFRTDEWDRDELPSKKGFYRTGDDSSDLYELSSTGRWYAYRNGVSSEIPHHHLLPGLVKI